MTANTTEPEFQSRASCMICPKYILHLRCPPLSRPAPSTNVLQQPSQQRTMMLESLSDHITSVCECIHRLEGMLAKLESSKTDSRTVVKTFSPVVNEARSHLQKASVAAFKHDVHFAMSPDTFNPFNLFDVDRSFSRLALHECARTMVHVKRVIDKNPAVESPCPEDRIGSRVVVYTITSGSQSESIVLHGSVALTSYKDDEADLRKTSPGATPLIANHGVRHRLLAACSPPGELDLVPIALLVEDSVGKSPKKADIVTRSWYCPNTTYILDVVCTFALVRARRAILEVPGVGELKDLVEEDTLSRYFGAEELDSEYREDI